MRRDDGQRWKSGVRESFRPTLELWTSPGPFVRHGPWAKGQPALEGDTTDRRDLSADV